MILTLFCVCFLFSSPVMAEEKATKEECIAKTKEAAALVKEIGLPAVLEKLNDPQGPFVWKDTYVFCINSETGVMLAHPVTPKLIGKMLKGIKDSKGKMFFIQFINMGNDHGEGWVSYMWPKPGEPSPSPKISYVYKVPGEDALMIAGIYE